MQRLTHLKRPQTHITGAKCVRSSPSMGVLHQKKLQPLRSFHSNPKSQQLPIQKMNMITSITPQRRKSVSLTKTHNQVSIFHTRVAVSRLQSTFAHAPSTIKFSQSSCKKAQTPFLNSGTSLLTGSSAVLGGAIQSYRLTSTSGPYKVFQGFPNVEVPHTEFIDVNQEDPEHLKKQVWNRIYELSQSTMHHGVRRKPKFSRRYLQVLQKMFDRAGKEFPNLKLQGQREPRVDEDYPPRDQRNNPKGHARVRERELRQKKILENMKKMPKMIEEHHRKEREERQKKLLLWPNMLFPPKKPAKPTAARKGPTPFQQMVKAKKYTKLDRLRNQGNSKEE